MEHAMNEMPLMEVKDDNIVLFHPHVPESAIAEVADTLRSRWIGQGPKVDKFERMFEERLSKPHAALAVGSGTDALHLAYVLAGIGEGDEVITPVFTCTATNIPLLYQRAKIRFADIQRDTLNIDVGHMRALISEKTKALVCVHYGGLPCDMDEISALGREYGIPVIEDAAQAMGATYHDRPIGAISDFTTFSFQAIKHITTGDGGMLTIKDKALLEKGKRIRWFGIDRSAKQMGNWENDIKEIGYKYQMTDIGAAIAIASMREFDVTLAHRQALLRLYIEGLAGVDGIRVIGADYKDRQHAAWICTVIVERRTDLQRKLRAGRIESNQVHYRNDRYSIFGSRCDDVPNMDSLENKYLVLPLHSKMNEDDVRRICGIIKPGW
jgi:dTDP-4-amino-4,6-dideoxygalactose transaminase